MTFLRPYLDLVRVFLTPSAPAESLVGALIAASGSSAEPPWARIAGVGAISILLYWFGMATNDVFDLRKDSQSAPEKVIPSGRLSSGRGLAFAAGLGLAALGLAAALGVGPTAALLLVAILAYNAGGKRIPVVGNVLMGACRAGNLLLGASLILGVHETLSSPLLLAAAGLVGVYVAGITAVSVLEDRPYRPRIFHSIATALLIVPVALTLIHRGSALAWINCVVLLWRLIAVQRLAASRRFPDHPAAVYLRGALGAIFFVDAGILIAFSPPNDAVTIGVGVLYALALLGWWWKKAWLQSGGSDT